MTNFFLKKVTDESHSLFIRLPSSLQQAPTFERKKINAKVERDGRESGKFSLLSLMMVPG
jgi:hypothetical protein